jgi:hypothetical protein
MRAITPTLAASLLLSMACDPKAPEPERATPTTAAQTNSAASSETPGPPKKDDRADPGPSPSEEISGLLDRAVAECAFSEEGALRKCKDRRLKGRLTRAVSSRRLDALAPLAASLTSPDPKRKILAARLIGRFSTFHLVDAQRGKADLDPELARHLIDFVSSADLDADPAAMHVVATATLAGTLAGKDVEVLAMLSTLNPERGPNYLEARATAIERLMTFTGLKHLDLIQRAADDPKHPRLQQAAMLAPRNLLEWDIPTQDLLCPWLATKLPEMKGEWDAAPARSIVYGCLDVERWHTAVLDEAQRRVSKGTYAAPLSRVVPTMCQPKDPYKKNPVVCAKARETLTAAAKQRKLDPEERAFAASTLADIFPDPQSRATLNALKSDKRAVVANSAKSALARLDKLRVP